MASVPAESSPYVQPRAAWRVTLDGEDLTAAYAPRLIALRLSEKLGEEADQLEIVVHDTDGAFAPPKQGAKLTVALGWDRGSPVSTGLVDKGSFTVDEVSWEGPPDKVTITARSADFKDSFRTRKTRIWHERTIGSIIGELAADNGLQPRCHPDLASTTVKIVEQHNKSDMQFLRDLGRHYDAIATVKAGCLIFAPRDATTTASGQPLPSAILSRDRCAEVSWRRASREKDQDGVEAQWHDQAGGKRKTDHHGGNRKKRLKRVYGNETEAKAAAQAEANRLKRASASLEVTLAWGNSLISPGMQIEATGFRPHIDQEKWRIASTEHSMDGAGFITRLTMEVAG